MSTKYIRKTFTPDGSAQLWAVACWPATGDEAPFTSAAPVVGWFAVEAQGARTIHEYTLPAVQDAQDPLYSPLETLEEWAQGADDVRLVHVSKLAGGDLV